MKKIRLASAFVVGFALMSTQIFGQNQQSQFQNTGQSLGIQSNPAANSHQFKNRNVPGNIGNYNSNTSFQIGSSNQTPTGQHTCKTFELNQKHYQDRGIQQEFNQSYLSGAQSMANYFTPKTSGVNEISVIFHVVHNPNNPSENVSNALIMQVYNDIVEDFQAQNLDPIRSGYGFTAADADINFCLATQDPMGNPLTEVGVIRVSTSEDWYDSDNGEENKMKSSATGGSDIWDRNKYLNVWICDISNGAGSGTAGYAYRPTTSYLPGANIDGIVLDYNLGMNNENVLTHEIGHYLGLDHTWGGSGGCGNDDGFTDTPVTSGPSQSSPTPQSSTSCSGFQELCSGVQTQYENFMDYSNCTSMFTQEQANYMLTILQGIRGSLLLSPGCDPTNTPPISAFTSIPADPTQVTIPQNASVSFIDQSTNVPTGWAWTISGTQGVDWAWINSTNQNSQDPVAEFYTVGTYTVSLTASNAYGTDLTPAVKTTYVNVAGIATGNACDTLRNYIPTDNFYTFTTTNGYVPGHSTPGGYQALEWAERYNAGASTQVRAIEFLPNRISNGGGSVTFTVYADNTVTPGIPGTVITTEVVPLSSMAANTWENVEFTTPANVTGAFWVGYQLNYTNPTDTFSLYTNVDENLAITHTYSNLNTIGWIDIGAAFNPDYKLAFIMDVLTSNGTSPAADFNTSSWEICIDGNIQVDGSISTDANGYQWYVTDDPVSTVLQSSTSSSNSFNFPYSAGNYRVYLLVYGSCVTDGIYMVATVFPDITATVTPTATTCGNNNGIITVTGTTGGGSTTYYYSIDGVNYQTSNVFNNLAPGNYTVSIGSIDDVTGTSLGSGCISTYTVNVGSSSAISPTVSTNISICPGGSATITAGGGTGYNWFNGATLIANSASTLVSPATTTQYSCVVTNGACSATVYTTVTIGTPTVTQSALGTVCVYNSPFTLTGGSPASGTYSGTGVTGGMFNPASAGTGTHTITYTYSDGNNCSNSATADIIVDACLSVSENDLINVKVYPNPTQHNLTIEVSGDFNYEILDTKGRIIEKGNGNDKVDVKTSEYSSGVYFVNLTSQKINTTIRVMKN